MARQNLLLVDGDARHLRVLEVSLRKAGFSITSAESSLQGLQYLETADPDLIISDTHLSDGDGFDFCRAVKQNPRWEGIPFIFLTSARELEDKVRGLELGVEDYLTKPIYVKEVMTRVKMLLQRKQQDRLGRKDARTKFSGQLADMAIVDLLQTIEISRKSGTIEFQTDLGSASVWFRDGRVIDAKMGRLQAAAAVYRLLGINEGSFEVEFRTISRAGVIPETTQGLLMEGMRRVDEWVRLLEGLPPLDHVLTIDAQLLAERPEPPAPAMATLLRRFDGRRTIIELIDDSGSDDLLVLEMISTLYFEGLLTDEFAGETETEAQTPRADPVNPEHWNPALTLAGVPPLPQPVAETSAHPATVADLPPLPSYPLPFPNLSASIEHEDALVGGIPEDVREPQESEEGRVIAATAAGRRRTDKVAAPTGPTVRRLESVDGLVALPMGMARAEAFGELQSQAEASRPDMRTHSPSSSIIVHNRDARPAGPGASTTAASRVAAAVPAEPAEASDSWADDTSPRLLNESSEDMSRLSALVASLNTEPSDGPSVAIPAAPARDLLRAPAPRSYGWVWATLGLAAVAAGLVVLWPRIHEDAAPVGADRKDASKVVMAETHPATKEAPVKVPDSAEAAKVAEAEAARVAEAEAAKAAEAEAARVAEAEAAKAAEAEAAKSVGEGPGTVVDEAALKHEVERATKLYMSGRQKEALVAVEAALELDPHHAPALLVKANVLTEHKEFAAAKQAAQAAIASERTLADAWLALGVIEQELGETEEAIAAYERFLELAPKSRYAASIRGTLKQLKPAG